MAPVQNQVRNLLLADNATELAKSECNKDFFQYNKHAQVVTVAEPLLRSIVRRVMVKA